VRDWMQGSVRKREFSLGTASSKTINPVYSSSRFVAQVETKGTQNAAPTLPALGRCQLHSCIVLRPV